MKNIFTAVFLLLLSLPCFSQEITGKIYDRQSGESLPGAHIRNISKSINSISSVNGDFSVKGNVGDSLLITYLGYKPLPLVASNQHMLIRLQPSINQMEQIVVTGTREETRRSEVPAAISTIGLQAIEETKASSLEQVLNKATAVYMVDLGNEQHAMAIRQPISYKSMFLYLEDGIPIRATGDFNHNALIELNMAAVKDVEIVRGPASASYGSEAIGGAINFVTFNPTSFPHGKVQAESGTTGYSKLSFQFGNTKGRHGISLAGYNAIQRNGWRPHSDMDKLALSGKYTYRINKKALLTMAATGIDYYSDQTGGIDSSHFYSREYFSPHTFTWREVQSIRSRATLEIKPDSVSSLSANIYYRNSIVGQNPFYAIKSTHNTLKSRGEINEDHFSTYGSFAQYNRSFNHLFSFSAGASAEISPLTYQARFISVDKNEEGIYTGYSDSDSLLTNYRALLTNYSAFGQFTFSPGKKVKITLSGRQDFLEYDFDNHLQPGSYSGAADQKVSFSKFTPRMGATVALSKNSGVYANAGYGFAPPVITELFKGVQVPVLKPATFLSMETGGWIVLIDGRATFEAAVYRMEGSNEIISVRLADGSYMNQNAGSTMHEGVEYSLRYQIQPGLYFRAGMTHMRHIYNNYTERGKDFSGNVMAASPGCIGNGELTWKPGPLPGLRMSAELQHISAYYMDAANQETYPGYNIINFRTGYTIRSFELWANLLNVTDEIYATAVEKTAWGKNYRPGAPRTLTLGLTWSFSQKTKTP